MTPTDLEKVYEALAGAVDRAGQERQALYLAKLALLLAQDLGDVALVCRRIEEAGLNLPEAGG